LTYKITDYSIWIMMCSAGWLNKEKIILSLNKLQYLHPDTFLGLPNIQYVLSNFNLFLQVSTHRKFINSHSFLHLDISDCNVSSVSVETIANVSAL